MNNLEEMDKFLKYNLPKVNQEQIQNLNRTIRSMEIKTVIKKIFQQANSQDQIASQMNSTKNFVSQFSRSAVSNSLRPHRLQHARPPYPSPTPRVYSNSCPLSRWCHLTISPSVIPSPPAFNLSQDQGLFQWVSSSHQVAKVLEFQPQHQSFQWTPRTDLL